MEHFTAINHGNQLADLKQRKADSGSPSILISCIEVVTHGYLIMTRVYKPFSVLSPAGSDIETVTTTISLVRSRNTCHRPSHIGGFSGTFSEIPAVATAISWARDPPRLLNGTAQFERAPTFQRV